MNPIISRGFCLSDQLHKIANSSSHFQPFQGITTFYIMILLLLLFCTCFYYVFILFKMKRNELKIEINIRDTLNNLISLLIGVYTYRFAHS